jgi:hypothetical protein
MTNLDQFDKRLRDYIKGTQCEKNFIYADAKEKELESIFMGLEIHQAFIKARELKLTPRLIAEDGLHLYIAGDEITLQSLFHKNRISFHVESYDPTYTSDWKGNRVVLRYNKKKVVDFTIG